MTTKTETAAKKAAAQKAGFEAFADYFTAPTFDAKSVFEFQRKNVEAVVEANKIIFEGAKAAAQKNIDLAKDTLAEVNEATTAAMGSKTPENGVQKSVEMAQGMLQKNIKIARESADVMVDAGQKAVAVLQDRYTESTEELKTVATK